ncbi:hypothetical protein NQ318_008496 [Aromia moschata]|uniref:PiggyBac transposable element-derived protein domain-containing protein n=1 Tax=Aromia moschata TaxID=1265417 RepID=A0AAV8XCJ0_9CUCU|nr:hypothetical protein NQ318_008496 [Aromia moschata]
MIQHTDTTHSSKFYKQISIADTTVVARSLILAVTVPCSVPVDTYTVCAIGYFREKPMSHGVCHCMHYYALLSIESALTGIVDIALATYKPSTLFCVMDPAIPGPSRPKRSCIQRDVKRPLTEDELRKHAEKSEDSWAEAENLEDSDRAEDEIINNDPEDGSSDDGNSNDAQTTFVWNDTPALENIIFSGNPGLRVPHPVSKWWDKRDVLFLSTEFEEEMIEVRRKRDDVVKKPKAIVMYNEHMSGIDRQDQMLAYYPTAMPNANISFYDYRITVIKRFLEEKDLPPVQRPAIAQHFPVKLDRTHRKRCRSLHVVEEDILDVTTIRTEVTRRLEENRVKQDLSFNQKRRAPKFYTVGDLVLNKVTSFPATNESKKLLPKFRGPFKVVEVLPNDRYRVQEDRHTDRSSRPYDGIVGIEHMKPFAVQQS